MNLIALGMARMQSTRCKRKMIRLFAGTTLTELAVKRLAAINNFDAVYFAAYENELLEIANKYLPLKSVIYRDKESAFAGANPDDFLKTYDFLRKVDFDYCMWINSCHVFLRPETIDDAASEFRTKEFKSMTAVKKCFTWFYTMEGDSINNDPAITSTQFTTPLLEVTHAFHIFSKDQLFKSQSYWNNRKNDPFLYPIDDKEALDIDTEQDFVNVEFVYKNNVTK